MKKELAGKIYRLLKKNRPDAGIELKYSTPLELLVATILSAQCTDIRVNLVATVLFKKYRAPEDYLSVPLSRLEREIKTTGFFRNKAKNIRGAMKYIIENHEGVVPRTMEELIKLPGVGRKTANVVLGNAFGIPGVVVDTHVSRVSQRIGFTEKKTPEKIEYDLSELFPKKEWTLLSHVLIFHGRYTCKARKPLCEKCPVSKMCDYYVTLKRAEKYL